MPNITLALDEELLSKSRTYANQKGTTLNALVRELLGNEIAQVQRRELARQRIMELSKNTKATLGADFKWNREEIYEERMFPRHQHSDLRGLNED